MPLQFVFGPSGSGKSFYLYHHVIEESMLHPEQNYMVLVPEQFTMQTQKDLVSMHPRHGIMNIDVLSFGRLAYRIFGETGGGSLPVLDDEGKNLILRKIAGDHEDELCVLRGNMKRLGYISEVKSVISEFMQYDIGDEELEKVMETVGEESRLYYKLQDIRTLYREFTAYLEKKYITKEELLDVLSQVAGQSDLLKNSTVVLDGFTGFTPVQNRLLKELMLHCRKVIITVTMDEREDPYVYRHPYQLFALSKHMVHTLTQIAKEAGVLCEEPVCLYDRTPYRFRDQNALAYLERNIFRYHVSGYGKEPEGIRLHVARSPKEEAIALAGDIRAFVRKEGCRFRDVGVIVSDMNVYGDYLEQAFEMYHIPVFMDHKRSILLNSFVEYIRSLLHMIEQNFTYESVFRFLRTQLAGFTCEETDALENYVVGLGIKGYKKWQERWVRKLKGMEEEELSQLNHSRVMLVEKVEALVFVLKQRRKTVKDITLALYEFMVKEDLQVKLKKQEEEFQLSGELALAKEYAQIYRILVELFDKFVELLGDEPVGLNEYCKLLDAGLTEARVGVIPPSTDQVVVGDVERTRLKDIQALFFIGANDVYLPGALLRNGLLSERDREKFGKEKLTLAPGGKERAYIQKFYLYLNLTKPSKRLEVYYSKVSPDGKSMRPSYLIQELHKLYPLLTVEDEEEKKADGYELTEQMGINLLIQGFQNRDSGGMDLKWQELYSWYKKQPGWKEKVEDLLRAGYYRRPDDGLTKAVAKKLYGEDFEDSITRMERFSVCAFSHFLTYGLKLKERQEYDFQAVDLGNVCHKALECFSWKVKNAGRKWTELKEEERKQYIEESVEEAITDYGNSVLYSTARNEYLIVRMKRMLERTVWALTKQLQAGDFEPSSYEVRFAGGKIDRVDTCMDGDKVYVKVLDYKTGTKAFDVVALYHGLQLQLMVYMNAAMQMESKKHPDSEIIPAGVFYYRISEPFVDKKQESPEEALLKEMKPDGIVHLKEDVLEHLDHCMAGESLVVPIKYNKNGSLSRSSKTASEDEFYAMLKHAAKKVEQIHGQILSGDTAALPYRRGQETGCDYCSYRHVCGFDRKIPGYEYRELDKMKKEEAIAEMLREE